MNNGKHSGNGHDPEENREDNIIRMPTLAERDKIRRAQEKLWRKEYKGRPGGEPMINLPPVTKLLILALVIPHLFITFALDDPTTFWVFEHFGFKPVWYTRDFPGWPAFIGPFSYIFLHGSWMHLGMNAVMLAAFGAGVEKWMGGKRLLVLFFACALAACIFHFILSPFSDNTMIGASGGVSGLFAAVLVMMQAQGRMPYSKYGIWPLAGLWIAISFIFGLLGGPDGSAIAWAAHIGGFLAGIVLLKPVLRMK